MQSLKQCSIIRLTHIPFIVWGYNVLLWPWTCCFSRCHSFVNSAAFLRVASELRAGDNIWGAYMEAHSLKLFFFLLWSNSTTRLTVKAHNSPLFSLKAVYHLQLSL